MSGSCRMKPVSLLALDNEFARRHASGIWFIFPVWAITSISRFQGRVCSEGLTYEDQQGIHSPRANMSVHEIIAELPKLSEEERELILRQLVNLDECFEPTLAMDDAIRQGLRSLREEKIYSAAEVRSRIAAWTAR